MPLHARYRATGADLPFGDPLPAHGVAMEGYFWRFTDPSSGRAIIALNGVNRGPDGHGPDPHWATLGLAAHPSGFLRTTVHPEGHASPTGLGAVAASERVAVRIAAGRILAERFRAGETVAALGSSRTTCRMVAVMPAYGVHRALAGVRSGLASMATGEGVELVVGRVPFGADPGSTFTALVHSPVG